MPHVGEDHDGLSLLSRVETLRDEIRAVREGQVLTDGRVANMVSAMEQLKVYVIEGNGKPSLLDRMTTLETHRYHDVAGSKKIMELIREIDSKLIAQAKFHEDQFKSFLAERDARSRERMGWYVAVGVAVLGLIGTLLQIAIPMMTGKK